MVIHLPIEARILEEKSKVEPENMIEMTHRYIELIGAHVVAVSVFKGTSWGFTDDIVAFWSDPGDYPPYASQKACGLRISNFISNRRQFLLWDFHERAFNEIPVRIVGHNPGMPQVRASNSWDHLKKLLQSHRFSIHTADPSLEDGYNMATVEAMAAGMPVLGNRHPGSPVEHGVSGFLSDDPDELRTYAKMLLADRDLAVKMGRQAQKTCMERFSKARFKQAFLQSIETARNKWHTGKVNLRMKETVCK
jgi:glycosyltransferase involved in cell wall biosynthesis